MQRAHKHAHQIRPNNYCERQHQNTPTHISGSDYRVDNPDHLQGPVKMKFESPYLGANAEAVDLNTKLHLNCFELLAISMRVAMMPSVVKEREEVEEEPQQENGFLKRNSR